MKSQLKWASLAAVSLVLALGASTAMAATGIANSKHNFASGSLNTYKGSSAQICIYCHAPHNTSTSAQLWNRSLAATNYTMYTSSTMGASSAGQPGNVSKLCLSCHDGTVAVDSFMGSSGAAALTTGGMITTSANLGTNLNNDHPIGIEYVTASAVSRGLKDPASVATAAALIVGGKVECSSCHDVHNTLGNTALVRVDNTGSALCITCHNK